MTLSLLAAAGMVFKVDCFYPCGTGDQPIDLTGYEPGTWQTFEYNVASLIGMGLNVSNVNAGLVLFPTWGDQQGYSFEVANVRYEADSADGGGDGTGTPPTLLSCVCAVLLLVFPPLRRLVDRFVDRSKGAVQGSV